MYLMDKRRPIVFLQNILIIFVFLGFVLLVDYISIVLINFGNFYSTDSIEKLKTRLPSLDAELKDNLRFKDFYQFTFNYAKNPGQKGLDLDMAITYWNIVLQGKFRFLDLWCKFLQVSNLESMKGNNSVDCVSLLVLA